jgi:hypothetical protein
VHSTLPNKSLIARTPRKRPGGVFYGAGRRSRFCTWRYPLAISIKETNAAKW